MEASLMSKQHIRAHGSSGCVFPALAEKTNLSCFQTHLKFQDFDAMPVVPQILLQLGDGFFERHNLIFPLLILVEPVGNLVCAAKHIRASPLIQLRQGGL